MKIIEIEERTPLLIDQLVEVWEKSVRATHFFLSDFEIEKIKKSVLQALNDITHLIVMVHDSKCPVAFMGIEKEMLEMLFIAPEYIGNGLGRELLQYGIQNQSIEKLAVNEQNPKAKDFYEYMGFQVYKRTDYDEQGNPYPLLYMKLS